MELVGSKTLFEVLPLSNDDATPLLVSFPGGCFIEHTDIVEINRWQKKSTGSKLRQIVSFETNGIEYRGSDFGPGGVSSDLCQYAICSYKKDSKKLLVLPVQHPYAMYKVSQDNLNVETTVTLSSATKRKALTEAFGSNKKKRAVRAQESNVISAESISGGSVLHQAVTDSIVDIGDASKYAADRAVELQRHELLPPYDEAATELSEVYPVNGIISDNIHILLEAHFDKLIDAAKNHSIDISTKELWYEYFLPRCNRNYVKSFIDITIPIPIEKIKTKMKTKLARLLYLDLMILFYKLISRGAVAKSSFTSDSSIPQPILRHISDCFSTYRKGKGEGNESFLVSETMRYFCFIFFLFSILFIFMIGKNSCFLL